MPTKRNKLIRFIGEHPAGITARDAAAALGWTESNTACFLSRLALYRLIDREMTGHRKGSLMPRYLYKPLPSAPSIIPPLAGSVAERNARRADKNTKNTKITAPPAADVESPSVASQPAGVE